MQMPLIACKTNCPFCPEGIFQGRKRQEQRIPKDLVCLRDAGACSKFDQQTRQLLGTINQNNQHFHDAILTEFSDVALVEEQNLGAIGFKGEKWIKFLNPDQASLMSTGQHATDLLHSMTTQQMSDAMPATEKRSFWQLKDASWASPMDCHWPIAYNNQNNSNDKCINKWQSKPDCWQTQQCIQRFTKLQQKETKSSQTATLSPDAVAPSVSDFSEKNVLE